MVILDVRWFSGRDVVGVVKVDSFNEIKYYIGAGKGLDEQEDIQYIADWGARLSQEIGEVIFA